MALILNDIKMPLTAELSELALLIAQQFDVPREGVQGVRIVRQSLDARKKTDIHFKLSALVQLEASCQARLVKSGDRRVQPYVSMEEYALPENHGQPSGRIVVAGLGPAGLFAAYFLAKAGYKPLVLERGGDMKTRRADVERFFAGGAFNEACNVAFGEGGAGTFSDGKLTSRAKNPRGEVAIKTLVEHGAPKEIAYMAKPHIGTDLLAHVIVDMRETIIKYGGEVRFQTQLVDIAVHDGALKEIYAQQNGAQERIPCEALILATGQAARDTYAMLLKHGVLLQPKPFAVGVRIEHPQGLIDRAQFGAMAGHPRLGAAEYMLTGKSGTRGVYTFCMCPGGHVIAANSGCEQVVTNGMSNHARDGGNANAAIIVQVSPEDFGTAPLDGVRYQEALEKHAYDLGGGDFIAPAQRLEDFLKKRKSKQFYSVSPTYKPGVSMRRLDQALPDYIVQGIDEGIAAFARQLKGFDYADAVLTGVESRSSAPVRIVRSETGQAANIHNLYPVGEGAGYAGGIVSAAIDGMLAAERVAQKLMLQPIQLQPIQE